ncbi:MAG: Mth938-like domain-containing protein [Lysobacterales bacterium]
MDLTLHGNAANAIRGFGSEGAIIGDRQYTHSLLVSAEQLIEDWPITAAAQLDREQAGKLLSYQPELVIVGTGPTLIFPPAPFAAAIMARHVGLESMDNGAACRTYNVLLDEGRNVLLALIQLESQG